MKRKILIIICALLLSILVFIFFINLKGQKKDAFKYSVSCKIDGIQEILESDDIKDCEELERYLKEKREKYDEKYGIFERAFEDENLCEIGIGKANNDGDFKEYYKIVSFEMKGDISKPDSCKAKYPVETMQSTDIKNKEDGLYFLDSDKLYCNVVIDNKSYETDSINECITLAQKLFTK